jgi:hypothetical protein
MAIRVTGNIVISDSQAISNITSINANGNVTTTGNFIGIFANGNSSIDIPAANGNINLSAGGSTNELVITTTGVNVAGTLNATGNANTGNLGTAQVLATANVTAPQLISNVSTGTAPLVVTSTTVVANLNANALQGNAPSQTATANSIVQRNADGNITGNFFIGNGSQLTGISAGFPLANGTSNINAPAADGNINISVGGAANVLVTTSTGVNVAGTLNASGNANTGNLGTATAVITTGNITTINSGLMQNGNSNVTITANANVTISAVGGARITATSAGANITGTLGVSGNANVNNLGTAQVLATANVTAPQLISNVTTGTAPLVVSSTTVVANLNANALQGNTPSQTATANSIVQRNADGNITGNFFIGNGSQLTGISAGFPLANGTSNINAPTSGGNINISVGGTANVLITTSTGVNVTGTFNSSGNANTLNLGTGTAIITTGNITTINSGLMASSTSNHTIASAGNHSFFVGGNATSQLTIAPTGVNVAGYLTVVGNITGGNISNSTNVYSTAAGSYAIGFRQMPQNSQSGATYTLVLDDEGKSVYLTGTTTCTVTVPANASQAFPIGSVLTMINNNSGNLSINSSATLQLANGPAANRTVLTKGMATCIKTAADTWYVIGLGVS